MLTQNERDHLKEAEIYTMKQFEAERRNHRRYARADGVELQRVCPVCQDIEIKLYAVGEGAARLATE